MNEKIKEAIKKSNAILSKDKIVSGTCKKFSDKFNINVVFVRLAILIIGMFVSFLPTVMGYILACILFSVTAGQRKNNTEETQNN